MDCDFKIECINENKDESEVDDPILSIEEMDTTNEYTTSDEIKIEINPWASKDLKEFLFYNCPECEYRASYEPDFYNHALSTHPKAKDVYEALDNVDEIYVPQNENGWYIYPDQPPNSAHTLNSDPTIEDPTLLEVKNNELIAEEYSDLKCSSSLFTSIENVEMFMEEVDLIRVKCPDCGVKFSSQPDLELHLQQAKRHHKWTIPQKEEISNENQVLIFKENGTFTCPFMCGASFENMAKLKFHFLYENSKAISCKTIEDIAKLCKWVDGKVICVVCKEAFNSKKSLQFHLRRSHKGEEFDVNCECCGFHFKDPVEFKKHCDFTCNICKKSFENSKAFYRHLIGVHDGLKCDYCEDVFGSLSKLKDHVSVTHEGNASAYVHMCEHCGESFKNANRLEKHVSNVHGDGVTSHMCEKCGESFDTPKDLKNHNYEKHTKHICDECGKEYATAHILSDHKRRGHQDDLKRFCEICQKMFANAAELYKHFCDQHPYHECPVRLGVDFYQCFMCQKVLASQAALYTHLKLTHKSKLKGKEFKLKVDAVPTKCTICDLVLNSYMECIDHILDNHGLEIPPELRRSGFRGRRKLYCTQCSFQSIDIKSYAKHRKRHYAICHQV